MKRKYIDGSNWEWVKDYSSHIIHIEDRHCGYISFVKVHEVTEKIQVDYLHSETILFDSGYSCLVFLPDHKNWCASAVYDSNNEIVEWYFDITHQNSVDESGRPFFDDLYLDIVVSPTFEITLLDEHELLAALMNSQITKSDFNLAYETRSILLEKEVIDKAFLVDFFNKYYVEMNR